MLLLWVKGLARKPDGLSSIPRSHTMGRHNQPLQVVLWSPHTPPPHSKHIFKKTEPIKEKNFGCSGGVSAREEPKLWRPSEQVEL